jgi:membrane-bound lytic murein transglycosylase MltF
MAAEKDKQLSIEVKFHKWKGDLDGMIQRRYIRALVVYNMTNYFVDKGAQYGVAHDALKAFETDFNQKRKLGKHGIHILFIPVSRDELFSRLVDGIGDIAVASLTITPERLKIVDFTDPTLKNVSEIVVTGPGAPTIKTVEDLSGQEVFVRKSSSFYESLTALNQRFRKEGKKEALLKLAPESLESEDLIEMANAGLIKILVVDQPVAQFWKQVFPNITLHPEAAVRTEGDFAWAIRKDCPQFKAALNEFIKKNGKGTMFGNMMFQRYLKSLKYVKSATAEAEMKKFNLMVQFFRKYGDKYQVDGILMAAQGYQESRLDQNVKSRVGAVGVMQVMPATGKELAVGDISQIEPNIHAGIKYMRFMINEYYKNEPMDDENKALMTFASYNCGPNRMRSLRKEAAQRGFNQNVWFGNVERIAAERVGQETVTYVRNIYKYYIAYKLALEEQHEREKIKEEFKKNGSR